VTALSLLLTVFCALARAMSPVAPFPVEAADVTVGGKGAIAVHLTIPDGFHIYTDMLAVSLADPAGLVPGTPSMPPGDVVPDPIDPSRTREQYEYGVDVAMPVSAPAGPGGRKVVTVKVRYQACRASVCLLPQDVTADAVVSVTARAGALSPGLLPLLASTAHAQDPGDEVAVRFSPGPPRADHVVIHVDLQGDWHLNKIFMGVSLPDAAGLTLGEPGFPPAHPSGKVEDGTFREDFTEDFDLPVPVTGPAGAHSVKAEIAYQACKGVSLCKMPTSEVVTVPVDLTGAPLPPAATPPQPAVAATEPPPPDVAAPAPSATTAAAPVATAAAPSSFALAQQNGVLALLSLVFLAGIGVSFTPCVLPMVPITMGMIGARGAGSRALALSLTMSYVLGLALVYTGLGVFAGLTGALFGSWLQSPMVTGGIAVFFVVMGAAMFGFFEVGVPSFVANRVQGGGARGGHVGAFVVGVIGAIVAGPCSGPVVVAILALIGQGGQVVLGAALMFAFSLGMGMIFLVTGFASGWLPARGPWMVLVKKAFGIVMWLGAIYYASPHLPLVVVALATAGVLLFTAVFAWPHADDGEGWFLERLRQAYAITGGLVGAYLLVGTLVKEGFILPAMQVGSIGGQAASAKGITWLTDEAVGVAKAQELGKPMIIDFTADWCAACHEMEKLTYTDPGVVAAAGDFVTVMVDCTSNDPTIRALQQKYGVLGLPTVVFVQPDGTQVDRTFGFVSAEEFLPRMAAAAAG
jgi:thiol:disulfide interchange protein DsbD